MNIFTSLEMILAVAKSHSSDRAIKSPNDDMRSAPKIQQIHVGKFKVMYMY